MNPIKQRGAASVVIVFVIIVVISSMLGVSFVMSSASLNSANMQNNASQANFLAESALERVVYNLNADPSCTALTIPDQQTLNNGTFEVTSASISVTDATECNIKVKGVMNGIVRYISTKIFNNGGAGGGGAGASFFEPFPDLLNWSVENNTIAQGIGQWDTENCNGTCPGTSGTGSFLAQATGGGTSRQFIGYRQATITTINTGGTGLTLNTLGGFKKASSGSSTPTRQDISIELIETGGAVLTLWSDTTTSKANVWTGISTITALPPNTSYDRLRIRYSLEGFSFWFFGNFRGLPFVWVDEINLSAAGGGGAAPDWQVVEWQEVSQ